MRDFSAAILATLFALFQPQLKELRGVKQNLVPFLDPDETCYDVVGCFSNKAPWYTGPRRPFPPKPPQNITTTMYFHNRETKDPNGTIFKIYPNVEFKDVPFSKSKPTFIISHGLRESGNMPHYLDMAKALLRRKDANVFITEYSSSTTVGVYYQALGDLRVVGRLTALVLLKTGIPPSKMHFIGHGLGAHVVAYAANYVTEKKSKPARITGLDPARPQFEPYNDEMVRLDKTDAEFVDIVHTTAGQNGYIFPSGHVDFYPNGGARQPGCEEIGDPVKINYCSNKQSNILFTKSLESDGCIVGEKRPALQVLLPVLAVSVAAAFDTFIPGVSTNSSLHCDKNECISMGLGNVSGKEGIFFVPTSTSSQPYVCNNKF